jgi:hypothetical protein
MKPSFWDTLSADDGAPRMTHREANQIIRRQRTYCRLRMDQPGLICTGGDRDYPPDLYDHALRVHLGYEPAKPESPNKRSRARRVDA